MARPTRVRFAPSPTGHLHVGGARTALYNYLFAKNQGGQFILRIEDTDLNRSTDESLKKQLHDLKWLGLHWDEGVDAHSLASFGSFGPYRQSQRLDIYTGYCDQLLESGLAYYDFRTDGELEKIRASQGAKFSRIPRPKTILPLDEARAKKAQGVPGAIRFKVDGEKAHKIQDWVRGEVVLPENMVGDFILMRSNGRPVYNFCCAIDDALMEISHVFRAEEHLSNTLRQQMIYEALGFQPPEFGHLSLILGQDKQKLSKRHGATSCQQYHEQGYLPEALLNFLALLGWSPQGDREIFNLSELIERFDGQHLHRAGAIFDQEKCKWMNTTHLRALHHSELWSHLKPLLEKEKIHVPETPTLIEQSLNHFKPKMETLNDGLELFRLLDPRSFKIFPEATEVLSWEKTEALLKAWKLQLEQQSSDFLGAESFVQIQKELTERLGVKGKQLFMPLRVAILGKPHGGDLQSLVSLIQRESLLERVDRVLAHF